MLLLILIPVLSSGFFLITNHLYHFVRLHRYDGQLLYLKTISLGTINTLIAVFLIGFSTPKLDSKAIVFYREEQISFSLLLLSLTWASLFFISKLKIVRIRYRFFFVILILFIFYFFDYIGYYYENLKIMMYAIEHHLTASLPNSFEKNTKEHIVWIFYLTVFSLLVSWLRCFFYTLKQRVISLLNKVKYETVKTTAVTDLMKDSPMDNDLFTAWIESKAILISLSNRKVYVGVVTTMGEPNESEGMDQEITIIPILSGYRDKTDLRVTFTTSYEEVQCDAISPDSDQMKAQITNGDFTTINSDQKAKAVTLTLRQDLIESLALFDRSIYQKYFEKQNKKPSSSFFSYFLKS